MYIAIASENGQVFQHFGRSKEFTLIETEEEIVVSKRIVKAPEEGHGSMAGFLKELKVDLVICGNIGSGAKLALSEKRIELVCGVKGEVMESLIKYLSGEILGNNDTVCTEHAHEDGNKCNCGI